MPIRNVNLTDELDRFVASKVKSGRFENASEVCLGSGRVDGGYFVPKDLKPLSPKTFGQCR